MFYLIAWKEFVSLKMVSKAEVVKTTEVNDALNRIKELNAQKRLTTTEYESYNLSELFDKQKLTLS
jgi:G3E family GTPase